MERAASLLLVAAVVGVGAGCGKSGAEHAPGSDAAPVATTTTVAEPPAPPASAVTTASGDPPSPTDAAIAALPACEDDPVWRCARIDVPFDRANPDAGTIGVAFYVLPHTDTRQPALDPLVYVPGGPGGSGWAN